MRHKRAGYKLKRDVAGRKALLRGLVTSVIEHERVITTVTKAKAVKPLVEKMITLAKDDTLHARRQAAAFLNTPASVQKLFDKLGARFVAILGEDEMAKARWTIRDMKASTQEEVGLDAAAEYLIKETTVG